MNDDFDYDDYDDYDNYGDHHEEETDTSQPFEPCTITNDDSSMRNTPSKYKFPSAETYLKQAIENINADKTEAFNELMEQGTAILGAAIEEEAQVAYAKKLADLNITAQLSTTSGTINVTANVDKKVNKTNKKSETLGEFISKSANNKSYSKSILDEIDDLPNLPVEENLNTRGEHTFEQEYVPYIKRGEVEPIAYAINTVAAPLEIEELPSEEKQVISKKEAITDIPPISGAEYAKSISDTQKRVMNRVSSANNKNDSFFEYVKACSGKMESSYVKDLEVKTNRLLQDVLDINIENYYAFLLGNGYIPRTPTALNFNNLQGIKEICDVALEFNMTSFKAVTNYIKISAPKVLANLSHGL